MPAQKASPAPLTTITPTVRSVRACWSSAAHASIISIVNAFLRAGRFNRMVPTPASTLNSMSAIATPLSANTLFLPLGDFKQAGSAHPAGGTHRHDDVLRLAAPPFKQDMPDLPCPRHAVGVTDGNGPTVHIESF